MRSKKLNLHSWTISILCRLLTSVHEIIDIMLVNDIKTARIFVLDLSTVIGLMCGDKLFIIGLHYSLRFSIDSFYSKSNASEIKIKRRPAAFVRLMSNLLPNNTMRTYIHE